MDKENKDNSIAKSFIIALNKNQFPNKNSKNKLEKVNCLINNQNIGFLFQLS